MIARLSAQCTITIHSTIHATEKRVQVEGSSHLLTFEHLCDMDTHWVGLTSNDLAELSIVSGLLCLCHEYNINEVS